MNQTERWQKQTYVDIRLSGSSESHVHPKGEADDPDPVSADLRMILK